MRIAVLYTGALRTIKGTIEFFKKNVLYANPQNTVDIFATIQNDSTKSDEEWEKFLTHHLQQNLKSLTWFDKNSPTWITLRENLLTPMQISDRWKDYLRTSGSMIEYYQMSKSYEAMELSEAVERHSAPRAPLSSRTSVAEASASAPPSRYDYIIRCRTDTVIAKPIDFNWLHLSTEDITHRLHNINKHLNIVGGELKDHVENTKKIIKCFFNTLYHPDMAEDEWLSRHKNFIYHSVIHPTHFDPITHFDPAAPTPFAEKLQDFIQNKNYILALRANIFYICKRDKFNIIATLGYMYGKYPPSNSQDEYWFNAESQFQKSCTASNLSFFSYDTNFEGSSLYAYNHEQYFTQNNTLLNNNCIYFLMRYLH
jgi:hypothetical protein